MLFPLTPRDQDSGARCVRERRIPPRTSLTFPHRGREPGSSPQRGEAGRRAERRERYISYELYPGRGSTPAVCASLAGRYGGAWPLHTSPVVRGQGELSSAFETRLIIVGFQDLLI